MHRSRPACFAAVALGLGSMLAACGDDGEPTVVDTTTSSAPSGSTTTTQEGSTTTVAPEPEGTLIEIVVAGGAVEGGVRTHDVAVGDEVTIRVTADVVDHVHVHGYDLLADTVAGEPVEITFTADIPGQFEVELEDRRLQIAELRVA